MFKPVAELISIEDGFSRIPAASLRKELSVMHHPKIKSIYILLCTLVLAAIASANVQAQQATSTKPTTGYHLLKRIEVGGEGGWDYLTVDSAAHRLYVSHATRVVVIDLDKGSIVG